MPQEIGAFLMNTLDKQVTFKGVGIHSGNDVVMNVFPINNDGIFFEYNQEIIEVSPATIGVNHIRSTSLDNGVIKIHTPEHFLAACYALDLSNIMVQLSSQELPIMDGSSMSFIKQLQPHLIKNKDKRKDKLIISENNHFTMNDSHYFAMPADVLSISVFLSYPNHWIKSMSFSYKHTYSNFLDSIASARTYGFTHEIDELKKQGLAKGGSLENALVISDEGYVNEPRFKDELARHKILDFIGDMSICGKELVGNFVLIKPSHICNCEFLKKLLVL